MLLHRSRAQLGRKSFALDPPLLVQLLMLDRHFRTECSSLIVMMRVIGGMVMIWFSRMPRCIFRDVIVFMCELGGIDLLGRCRILDFQHLATLFGPGFDLVQKFRPETGTNIQILG